MTKIILSITQKNPYSLKFLSSRYGIYAEKMVRFAFALVQSVSRAGVKQLFTQLWLLLICSKRQSLVTVLLRGTFILMMTLHSTSYTVIIWLAPWAARMNWILCCDWLPERAKCCYPARSGLPAVFRKKIVTKLVWSRWLDIGLILFYVFLDRDRVEVHKLEKIIRPMSSHLDRTSWAITHINLDRSFESVYTRC